LKAYSFDVVNIRLKPGFDADLNPRASLLKPFQNFLISSRVAFNEGVLEVFEKWMLIAHFNVPFYEHVGIKQVLRAFDIILALLLNKGGLNVRVDAQLQIFSLVGLKT